MGLEDPRWVQPQGIHLTLKFLGEISEDMVDLVHKSVPKNLLSPDPFQLSIAGLGCFPSYKAPQVVWSGIEGDLESLNQLQVDLDQQLHRSCSFPMEKRPFKPHLTLARVRKGTSEQKRRLIGEIIRAFPPPPKVRWQVSHLTVETR